MAGFVGDLHWIVGTSKVANESLHSEMTSWFLYISLSLSKFIQTLWKETICEDNINYLPNTFILSLSFSLALSLSLQIYLNTLKRPPYVKITIFTKPNSNIFIPSMYFIWMFLCFTVQLKSPEDTLLHLFISFANWTRHFYQQHFLCW